MKIRVIKLGTRCTETSLQLEGTVTHLIVGQDARVDYLFQPHGLRKDCTPHGKEFAPEIRLTVTAENYEEIEVPLEILGTQVTDMASGFTGTAIAFVRHINGCFHVSIQPPGLNPGTGEVVNKMDFDLRQCEGEKIRRMSEGELRESKTNTPSPTGDLTTRSLPTSVL